MLFLTSICLLALTTIDTDTLSSIHTDSISIHDAKMGGKFP